MATQAAARAGATGKRETASKSIFRDYALAWVLLALFLGAWIGQFYTGWVDFVAEAEQQGESAAIWGQDGYVWHFSSTTFENWQSEFLQLLTFVVLTSFLLFRGSPESKDSDEELKQAMERLTSEVKELRKAAGN